MHGFVLFDCIDSNEIDSGSSKEEFAQSATSKRVSVLADCCDFNAGSVLAGVLDGVFVDDFAFCDC